MPFQRRDVATGAPLGAPGPLPPELRGLTGDVLADLTGRFGGKYDGLGYVRVPEPVPVPAEIDRLWARLALQGAGLLEAVEAAVAGSDDITRIYYADAASFRRDSPLLATVTAGLGLDAAAVDQLFLTADALKRAAEPT
jgi:hypothetical protein